MSPELRQALTQTRDLFKDRCTSDDWGRNIIEGSYGIKTERDWLLYYSFLANPEAFDENAELVPSKIEPVAPPPNEFNITYHDNGNETTIVYTRKKEVDDEKTAVEE